MLSVYKDFRNRSNYSSSLPKVLKKHCQFTENSLLKLGFETSMVVISYYIN